jgi:hypothetical protein
MNHRPETGREKYLAQNHVDCARSDSMNGLSITRSDEVGLPSYAFQKREVKYAGWDLRKSSTRQKRNRKKGGCHTMLKLGFFYVARVTLNFQSPSFLWKALRIPRSSEMCNIKTFFKSHGLKINLNHVDFNRGKPFFIKNHWSWLHD